MDDSKILFYCLMAVVFVYAVIKAYMQRSIRCSNCADEMTLEKVKDSMGVNINNKTTFSFYIGPRRYTQTWCCKSCGNKLTKKHWGQ